MTELERDWTAEYSLQRVDCMFNIWKVVWMVSMGYQDQYCQVFQGFYIQMKFKLYEDGTSFSLYGRC